MYYKINELADKGKVKVIQDMPEMCQFVFEFYQQGGLVNQNNQKMDTE